MSNITTIGVDLAKSIANQRGKHKSIVAIANKTARMVWVALNKGSNALPADYLSA